ncbi:hypothetical protein DPMN_194912 [Dreissena polymorpha]|uniref:Uncharacterized protein n=1 Tax=Dreissena polymorpha TaxID=45954 RepID=A0A9D3Y3R6_DREPO|nr:hypothetical protein DPMN_194912 [Dreissena polymorpha]
MLPRRPKNINTLRYKITGGINDVISDTWLDAHRTRDRISQEKQIDTYETGDINTTASCENAPHVIAASIAPDQPARSRSLVRNFAVRYKVTQDFVFSLGAILSSY